MPNVRPLLPPEPQDIGWWGDASTSFGIGVVVGPSWAVWKWRSGFKVGPKELFDIGWAEAVAVELGMRLALQQGLLSAGNFLVRSDNEGVVKVLNKGRSRSRQTNQVLKHVYLLQAPHTVRLFGVHVAGRFNLPRFSVSFADPTQPTDSVLHARTHNT